jgi:hypothetical protein
MVINRALNEGDPGRHRLGRDPLALWPAAVRTTTALRRFAEERRTDPESADNVSKAPRAAKGAADLAAGLGAAFGGDPNVKPVDPVSFRDLIALLPSPAGWEREKPTGERMTSPVSFADASVRLMKGEATVTVKITDSGFNQLLVAPFAMFLAGNYEKETSGLRKSVKIGDAPGLEKWDSQTKSGDLNVIVNKRFIVEVDGSSIDDPKVLHTMLDGVDLKKLADLSDGGSYGPNFNEVEDMNRKRLIIVALTLAVVPGSYLLLAQQPAAPAGQGRGAAPAPQPMSFFITSAPNGDGANYGGLAGADAYCQQLGTAAGRGAPVTWHAY